MSYKNTPPALSCTLPDALGRVGEGCTLFTCKALYLFKFFLNFTPDLLTNTASIMKLFPLLNFAYIVDSNVLSRIARTQIATLTMSGTSINTATKSNILRSHSPNINYLKPFDTAVLVYHIMGLSNFE